MFSKHQYKGKACPSEEFMNRVKILGVQFKISVYAMSFVLQVL